MHNCGLGARGHSERTAPRLAPAGPKPTKSNFKRCTPKWKLSRLFMQQVQAALVLTWAVRNATVSNEHDEVSLLDLAYDHSRAPESSMLTVKGIDHVVLRVSDIDAMRRFYCEVLGATHV